MVPTLRKKEDIQDRIANAMKIANPAAIVRKQNFSGESSVQRRLKLRMARLMKSKIQPKTGLEDK